MIEIIKQEDVADEVYHPENNMTPTVQILIGDALAKLKELPDESVQCCVTSPPYWGLRSYLKNDHPDKELELGQEKTPEEYISKMTAVFSEVKRVLKSDGVIWVNIGDSYNSPPSFGRGGGSTLSGGKPSPRNRNGISAPGLKPKDLVGIPWMLAFALRADGWYVRSDIIWHKANCMPESVTDRPTKSHEHIFLFSKNERYFYNHEAIKEPCVYDVNGTGTAARKARTDGNKLLPNGEVNGIRSGGYKNSVNFNGKNHGNDKQRGHSRRHDGFNDRWDQMEKEEQCSGMRNKRDVWTVAPANFDGAHFATFPSDLIKPCILAGSRPGDTVLDQFLGSGTTAEVSLALGRNCIGIDLNPEYQSLIKQRTQQPGFILK